MVDGAALAAVGHQVNLKKARAVLLPVGKGSDGNGVLKQASWLGSGKGATPL